MLRMLVCVQDSRICSGSGRHLQKKTFTNRHLQEDVYRKTFKGRSLQKDA